MGRAQRRDKGIYNSLTHTLNFMHVDLLAILQTGHGSNTPYPFILLCVYILPLSRTSFVFPVILSSGHPSPRTPPMTPLSASYMEMPVFLLP